jgi:hypothetical protein
MRFRIECAVRILKTQIERDSAVVIGARHTQFAFRQSDFCVELARSIARGVQQSESVRNHDNDRGRG